MFGHFPNSGAPISGLASKLYKQSLTYLVTSIVSIFSSHVFPKVLSVSVTATLSYVRAISKLMTTVTEMTIVILTEIGLHLIALSKVVTGSFTITKAISITKTISSTATVALVKLISLIKSISPTVIILLKTTSARFKTLTITVTTTVIKLISRLITLFVFISGTPLYAQLSGIVNDAVLNLEVINGNISAYANAYYLQLFKQVNKITNISVTSTSIILRTWLRTLTVLSTAVISLKKQINKILNITEVTVDTLLEIGQHVLLFAISVTAGVSIKKGINKLLFASSYVIIKLSKFLPKTLIVLVTGFTSMVSQVSPIFGAISSNVYYAIQRVRKIDLVKIRTIFLDKNNGK